MSEMICALCFCPIRNNQPSVSLGEAGYQHQDYKDCVMELQIRVVELYAGITQLQAQLQASNENLKLFIKR